MKINRGAEVGLVILGLLWTANVFVLSLSVPKFEQIFADALPGKPLPDVTEFIFRERIALICFVLALPIPALVMFWRRRPYAVLWINLGMIWLLVQGAITVIALVMPMVGTTTGMADAGR